MRILRADSDAERLPTWLLFFETGSDFINTEGHRATRQAVGEIGSAGGKTTVLIKGYADSRGESGMNQILSERRAKVVHDLLLKQGVSPASLEFIGVGETESNPDASNDEMRLERRVEITVAPNP